MRYGDLTYEELGEASARGWLAVVPTGCTEQQGPHLPVDFDTWFCEELCLAASEAAEREFDVRSVVLPTMPFGPTPEHRNYGAGFIDLPRGLHEAVVHAVLKSLAEQGFRRMVVWRGCGGHDLREAVTHFNRDFAGWAAAFLPGHPYHEVWCRVGDPAIPGGHADSFTTSIAMYLRPESVRTDKVTNPKHPEVDWSEPDIDFKRYSGTGVIGDPTHGSVELGEKLWAEVVREVASVLKAIAEGELDARPVDYDRLHMLRRTPYGSGEGNEG